MKRFALILSLIAMMFISCEGGFGEGGTTDFGNITLDENSTELLNQTLNSDELTGSGITFTATAPWSASVQEVRAQASWLTISPDHGDAGTYTLEIALEANTTGDDRTAEIVISCEGSTMKVRVTQKAAEQTTPSTPVVEDKNRITAIILASASGYTKERSFFTYNDKGDIAAIKYDRIEDNKLTREITQAVNYDGRNATISEKRKYISEQSYPQKHNLLLEKDEKGGSAILNSDGTLNTYNYDGEIYYVTYGKDGRVDKYTNENAEALALFTWEDGNITGMYLDELETTVTINYSEIENICGGVDWLWLLLNMYVCEEEYTPLAVLNKNGGLHTKKLPSSLSAMGQTMDLTYTFDEQGRIETVTFDEDVLEFGYADDSFVGYAWAPHVVSQQVVNCYNELAHDGGLGYTRNCVVRTYCGEKDYFDTTYSQDIALEFNDGLLTVGPEYKYSSIDINDANVYYEARYRGFYTESYIDEWDRTSYYAYYDFSTFIARNSFRLDIRSEARPWMYNLTTGEQEYIEWPNEEWVPYFDVREFERSKGNATEGRDENGVTGVTQWYFIQYGLYATLASKDADPTKLNYSQYDTWNLSLLHWIPDTTTRK